MKKSQIDLFEKLNAQLGGLHDEISSLSKKAPNDAVNKFKLTFINQIVADVNAMLTKQYQPFDKFNGFSEDEMPSNSDVTLVLLQYIKCMEKLRADNIKVEMGRWYWVADGKTTDVRTAPPMKLE